ncbi:MAG TPA: FAD:protein FMN transferase [Sediminibacterium sp.]|nr:FAD:protein FMN transferase [Sediminibacterium sp.]
MGSPFQLVFICDSQTRADSIAQAAYQLTDKLNAVFSDYDSTSEIGRINRQQDTGWIAVSPLLYDILYQSHTAYRQSAGAFDVTIGALSGIWRKARKERAFADPEQVKEALQHTGGAKMILDTVQERIRFTNPGVKIDLGGIAKGYTAGKVLRLLQDAGIRAALVDAGGDMAISDAPPGARGWRIGVNIPQTTDSLLPKHLLLHNISVATSGDAYQYIAHDGKIYSHIIDPHTGYGVQYRRNVTVIAQDPTLADWLATACSILPLRKAKKLVLGYHAELLITEMHDDRVHYFMTKGFGAYWER